MKRINWKGEGGYRELLVLSIPLIITNASWSLQQFIDRMFLAWYSPEAIAAVMPAGMLNFTLMSIFLGTCWYTTTFVAQYHGAGRDHRIGPAVWQGVHYSFIGGMIIMVFVPFSREIFNIVGHDPLIRDDESVYFAILSAGSFLSLASSALSGFFSGRGITWPILWVNIAGTIVNIVLDYMMIFGRAGFPEMGIAGAAAATVLSAACVLVIYILLFFLGQNEKEFRTRSGWKPEAGLFRRLVKYGFPSGLQFFIEISAFTVFVLIIGRLGLTELAASNIAFNINTLAFMPIIGLGIGVMVLTGQYIGRGRPETAAVSVYSGIRMALLYMAFIGAVYILLPDPLVSLFMRDYNAAQAEAMREMCGKLLRFVALYSFFDAMSIIFSSALKGAGDTSFVMKTVFFVAVFSLVIPAWAAVFYFGQGIYASWWILTIYAVLLGFTYFLRFRHGSWKSMSVIGR